ALEVVGGPWARSTEQPFRADHRPVVHLQGRCDADRLLARVLDVDLEMVLQVLADSWQIGNDVNPVRSEETGRPDAGELKQLRGVDGSAGQDDLARAGLGELTALAVFDADSPGPLEQDLRDERPGEDGQVGPAHDRVQIRARG